MMNNNNRNRTFSNFPLNFIKYNARYMPQEEIIPQFSINNYEQNYPFQTSNFQDIPSINSQNRNDNYSINFNEPNISFKRNLSVDKLNINREINYLEDKLYQLENDNQFLVEKNNHLKEEYYILNDEFKKIEFVKEDSK